MPPSPNAPDVVPPPAPGRLLLRASLWLLTAEFAAFATSVLIGAAARLSRSIAAAEAHAAFGWHPDPLVLALSGTIALQVTLLCADLRQGHLLGCGSLAAGLGARPARHLWLIVLLAALMIGWIFLYIGVLLRFQALADFIATDVPPAPVLEIAGGPLLIVLRRLLIVVLAPIAEELFFRGWLWTALRRSWSVWPTAFVTGGIWLALHALEGPIRVPILLPAAILLSLARHYGGSVRASIPIHVVNNLTALGIQIAAVLLMPR